MINSSKQSHEEHFLGFSILRETFHSQWDNFTGIFCNDNNLLRVNNVATKDGYIYPKSNRFITTL